MTVAFAVPCQNSSPHGRRPIGDRAGIRSFVVGRDTPGLEVGPLQRRHGARAGGGGFKIALDAVDGLAWVRAGLRALGVRGRLSR
ncbi:MAG: hypothetical protein ACREKS_00595 [Candidatus Rokuibacteriota bacterium]